MIKNMPVDNDYFIFRILSVIILREYLNTSLKNTAVIADILHKSCMMQRYDAGRQTDVK